MAARKGTGKPGLIISWIRNMLVGRNIDEKPWLRVATVVSTRSPDPPNLPDGPAHRLAFNYYCDRDERRKVMPPVISNEMKHLPESADNVTPEEVSFPALTTPQTPGVGHKWTLKQN